MPRKPSGPCGVEGCARPHLALGKCGLHYYRDKRAEGRYGACRVAHLRGQVSPYGAGHLELRTVTCRITVGVLVDCPACRMPMAALDASSRYCTHCWTTVTLNPEEVSWVIYEQRTTEQSKRTERSSASSTTP